MDSVRYYYIFGIVVFLIVAAGVAYEFFLKPKTVIIPPPIPQVNIPVEDMSPAVYIWRNGTSSIAVRCKNLPIGTSDIQIFRSKLNEEQWLLWKTKRVYPGCDSEIIEVSIVKGDDPFSYRYYFKAVDEEGNDLWVSDVVFPSETPPPNLPGSSGNGAPGTAPPGSVPPPSGTEPPPGTVPGTAPPPQSTSSPGTPGTGSSDEGNSGNPNEITYYTPSVILSGTSTPQTANFWVSHVDKRIEIGWQNVSPQTSKAIVSRSPSSNGPWEKLLEQEKPATNTPYFIRIVDNTLHEAYYYKLETRSASNSLLNSYGPILLEPLE